MDLGPRFTLVFEGELRDVTANPLRTKTPFGIATSAGRGHAFEKIDALEAENLRLRSILEDGCDLGLAPDECREALSKCPADL